MVTIIGSPAGELANVGMSFRICWDFLRTCSDFRRICWVLVGLAGVVGRICWDGRRIVGIFVELFGIVVGLGLGLSYIGG